MVSASISPSVFQPSISQRTSGALPATITTSHQGDALSRVALSRIVIVPRAAWNGVRHAGLIASPRITRVAASMRHQIDRGTEFTLSSIERVLNLSEARALRNRALVGYGFLSLAQLARWATVPAYIVAMATSKAGFAGLSLVGALGLGAFVSSSIGMTLMRSVAERTIAHIPDLKKEAHVDIDVDQQTFSRAMSDRLDRIQWMVKISGAMDLAKQKYIRLEGKVFSSNQLLSAALETVFNVQADLQARYAQKNDLSFEGFDQLYTVYCQNIMSPDADRVQKTRNALDTHVLSQNLQAEQKDQLMVDFLSLRRVNADHMAKEISDKIRSQLKRKTTSIWLQKTYNWHFKSLEVLYPWQVSLFNSRDIIPSESRTREDGTHEKGVMEYFDSQTYSTDQTKKTRAMIIERIAVRPNQAAVDSIDLLKWRDQTQEKLDVQNEVDQTDVKDLFGHFTEQEKKELTSRGIDISRAEEINQMTSEELILAAFDGLTNRQKADLEKVMPLDDQALKVERAIHRHIELHPTQFNLYAKVTPSLGVLENLEEVDIKACVDCIREKRNQKISAYLKVYEDVFQSNDQQFSEFILLVNRCAGHQECLDFFEKYGLDPKNTQEKIFACFSDLLGA